MSKLGDRLLTVASAAWTDPRVLKGIGTVALVGALVVAVLPGLFASVTVLRVLASPIPVFLLGALAVALAVQAFRAGGDEGRFEYSTPDYGDRDPADAPRVGRAIDEQIERLRGDETDTSAVRDAVVSDAWQHLRETAVETMVTVEGIDRETANARIRDGSWTDDPRAARFLGGEEAPPLPVWLRIADWLRGAPSVRRIEATVEAIQRHADIEGANAPGPTLESAERAPDEGDAIDDSDPAVAELEAFLERAESRTAADGGERE